MIGDCNKVYLPIFVTYIQCVQTNSDCFIPEVIKPNKLFAFKFGMYF